MKTMLPAILIFAFLGCFRKPTDHDLRVAAKKIIRKEFAASSSKPTFAPDDKIKIIRENGDKTFYISMYTIAQNASGEVTKKEWNLHLLYKGGSLPNIKNWKVLQ